MTLCLVACWHPVIQTSTNSACYTTQITGWQIELPSHCGSCNSSIVWWWEFCMTTAAHVLDSAYRNIVAAKPLLLTLVITWKLAVAVGNHDVSSVIWDHWWWYAFETLDCGCIAGVTHHDNLMSVSYVPHGMLVILKYCWPYNYSVPLHVMLPSLKSTIPVPWDFQKLFRLGFKHRPNTGHVTGNQLIMYCHVTI